MAAGSISLQANDLRVATVTFEDGAAGNVSVVVPKEGGVLASEAHVASQIGTIPVIGDASETVKGIIELATNAEVQTGTDAVKAVTPAGMKAGLNASGTAPVYATRAWVNFNGTGTVAIRASGNVSSITDNSPGLYTVNFITPMPDVNYAICATGSRNSGATNYNPTPNIMSQATYSCQIRCHDQNSDTATDALYVNISIFR